MDLDELVEHWTLLDDEQELIAGSAQVFVQVALRHGVEVVPGAAMNTAGGHDDHIRLPFTFPPDVLDMVVARLAPLGRADRRAAYVASTTLTAPEWGPTTVLTGDVPAAVAELKQKPGRELQVHGSGELVRTLHEHDLVDEYWLLVFPVVVGEGRRLFPDRGVATGLALVESRTTGSGWPSTCTGRPAAPSSARSRSPRRLLNPSAASSTQRR